MAEFFCTKAKTAHGYALMPAHQSDLEEIKKLPVHQPVRVKVTRIRNVDHHRKWWALVNYAFDVWEPPDEYLGEKNLDRFRKDVIILAGFYEKHWRLDGTLRIEPRSISFSSMSQDKFDELYAKTFEVINKHVLKTYSGEELQRVMRELEEFE